MNIKMDMFKKRQKIWLKTYDGECKTYGYLYTLTLLKYINLEQNKFQNFYRV